MRTSPGRFLPLALALGVGLVLLALFFLRRAQAADSIAPAATAVHAFRPDRPESWAGAPGPGVLRFTLPPVSPRGQPLISVGGPAKGGVLLLFRTEERSVRIVWERAGFPAVVSPDLPVAEGNQELEFSIGALMPPAGEALFRGEPQLLRLRDRLFVRLNGTVALNLQLLFEPAQDVVFGVNRVGGAMAQPFLEGAILSSAAADPVAMERASMDFAGQLSPADRTWGGYPGPLRLSVVFPTQAAGRNEPLVTSGAEGAADFIFVRYLDDATVRFGFDHWGVGGPVSEPVKIRPGEVHEMILSMGSLMPAEQGGFYAGRPSLLPLRTALFLQLDETVVFNTTAAVHPSTPQQIMVAANPLGGSSAGGLFTGRILRLAREAPDALIAGIRGLIRPGWSGFPGAVRIKLAFPEAAAGTGDPLLTTGVTGAGDFVFVRYEPRGMGRIGFDHWGVPTILSEPLDLRPGTERTLVVRMGSLYPPAGATAYRRLTGLSPEGRVRVELDGRVVLDLARPTHPSPADEIRIGENRIGGSSSDAAFGGRIISVESLPNEEQLLRKEQ